MKVWIFQTGEPLHCDDINIRPMRAMNLANALVDCSHEVTLWSSAYSHQERRHRCSVYKKMDINTLLQIRLIPSRGYKRNIGFGRILDHIQLGYNLYNVLKNEKEIPDVAFIGFPPIEFALVAQLWLNKIGVPTMLDVKDQWPVTFVEVFPPILQGIARIIFSPYFYISRSLFREVDALCTMASGFMDWILRFSDRSKSDLDCVSPLAPMPKHYTQEVLADTKDWWSQNGVNNDGIVRFFFIGSLSRAFNFDPIIRSAQRAAHEGYNWQFVLCGDGEMKSYIREKTFNLPNLILPGWIDRPQIITLAEMSDAGLAPYKNTNNFICNMPNKVIDYLSLGKPIISPLKGEVKSLIRQNNVGIIYDDQNSDSLFEKLRELSINKQAISSLSNNALELYNREYSGEIVYRKLVEKLIALSNQGKKS